MAVSAEEYLKALQDINLALTTGLQTAIALLENYERLPEEQHKSMTNQLKQLVESSHNVYRPAPSKNRSTENGKSPLAGRRNIQDLP
jgi:hypothetical protein